MRCCGAIDVFAVIGNWYLFWDYPYRKLGPVEKADGGPMDERLRKS